MMHELDDDELAYQRMENRYERDVLGLDYVNEPISLSRAIVEAQNKRCRITEYCTCGAEFSGTDLRMWGDIHAEAANRRGDEFWHELEAF